MDDLNFSDLTHRRDLDRPDCWYVYCGDICAGHIAKSVGRPDAHNEYVWHVGFRPGSRPGECKGGTSSSFESACEAFENAWLIFAQSRTAADFQAYREQRDSTALKYRLRDPGQSILVR